MSKHYFKMQFIAIRKYATKLSRLTKLVKINAGYPGK